MAWQTLFAIYLPTALQIISFSLLAWMLTKRRGGVPFELAGCSAIGTLVAVTIPVPNDAQNILRFCAGALSALAAVELFHRVRSSLKLSGDVFGIIFSLCILVLFDFVTEASPISLNYPGIVLLHGSVCVFLFLAAVSLYMVSGTYGARLRLGERYNWASDAWLRRVSKRRVAVIAFSFCAWALVLSIPLSTTGVASQTIFRDTTFAVLIAKTVALWHPAWILPLAVVIVAAKTYTTYVLAGPFGTVTGDLVAISLLCLLVGLRASVRTT